MGTRFIYQPGEAEIIEKKSRFIAAVQPVRTEEEALAFIAGLKKKYWNATHNCWAYVVGERGEIARCSDDGEPQGTAGRPMLEVLQGQEIRDVVVVVTRYFGGTLLGTGGLVRAYSRSVQAGLSASVVLEKLRGSRLTVETDYNGAGKIQYLLGQRGLRALDTQYSDRVKITVLVPEEAVPEFLKAVTEATSGKAVCHEEKGIAFAYAGTEAVIF